MTSGDFTLFAREELSKGYHGRWWMLLALLVLQLFSAGAQPASLTIAADQPGHPISPTLYGIFFEDINCSADGGLYAELVRNRNFEDSDAPDHWQALNAGSDDVSLTIDTTQPVSDKNPRSL